MRRLAMFVLWAWSGLAHAEASCIDSAADRQAFDECAQKEILPLEAQVVSRFAALRSKYRDAPSIREALERSEDAWNAYRNSHCELEAQVRGRGAELEVQRAFAACAKRTLETRLRELEAL